jgi:hypothetical protein
MDQSIDRSIDRSSSLGWLDEWIYGWMDGCCWDVVVQFFTFCTLDEPTFLMEYILLGHLQTCAMFQPRRVKWNNSRAKRLDST